MSAAAVKAAKRSRLANDLFRALADPSRREMLEILSDQDLPLRLIEERFDMSRPAVIKHLRVLKACRLVEARKEGRETIHHLNSEPLTAVRDWVAHFEAQWDKHLKRLKRQVEADR
jgi:DNA-binding transcriptional ArsR family regulator